MKKVIQFSLYLLLGLLFSQLLPFLVGPYSATVQSYSNMLLCICLAFVMINVGREFELDKNNLKQYTVDYFVAMLTAAMPWLLICCYYIYILLPAELWNDWGAWKESLLLSRFAAPTSAGILFTMLAAVGLKSTWMYKKTQVLAIFDDLDTILLMIPLQVLMVGAKWQLFVMVLIVVLLLIAGWKRMDAYAIRQNWYYILFYSIVIYGITLLIEVYSKYLYGAEGAVHIEVLLPAFIFGVILKTDHEVSKRRKDTMYTNCISYIFMFLVGLSMPSFFGVDFGSVSGHLNTVLSSQPQMGWTAILIHVIIVSVISNIGKLVPVFFYRDRPIKERLALSVGMFTRGEVGAGVIFIAISYGVGGSILIISVLSILLNLVLTGFFVSYVRKVALSLYKM